jgi:hypothetical protein
MLLLAVAFLSYPSSSSYAIQEVEDVKEERQEWVHHSQESKVNTFKKSVDWPNPRSRSIAQACIYLAESYFDGFSRLYLLYRSLILYD